MDRSIVLTGRRERIAAFVWQHVLLIGSLFLMTLGVALCVRSNQGSSVISSLPLAFSLAGADGLGVPDLSIGTYTYIMNFILVGAQIIVLRRRFEAVQLFQLLIGFVFGALIDLNMALTSMLQCDSLWSGMAVQFAGCTVMGVGIAFEVRCGSVTMPGEGITVAISRVSGMSFPKTKMIVDTTLVGLAVVACYIFWGAWQWNITGVGTVFAMVYVGYVVKLINPHIAWFDRILDNRPGFGRYYYGLKRILVKSLRQ